MIIRIQAPGGSFLGAGKYYLHDKLNEERVESARSGERLSMRDQSDDRVWFTDTRNTLNTEPNRALEEMWRTAEDQAYLKMQAGVKRGGRVCEDPVKTLSLSWHKDDQPTPDHMIESADAFLKHMGWDGHQALFVGHNDTEHRHIHIILNRVNPENGRTIDDYREQKRAQVWALGYEKEQENVRCEERELRAAKREHRAPELDGSKTPVADRQQDVGQSLRTPANDHLPHNVIMLSRENERAFQQAELQRQNADHDLRAELKAEQRAEREAFFKDGTKQFKALRHAVYDEVRKEFTPQWREFYKDAKAAEQSAEAWSKSAVTRALYFAKEAEWHSADASFADRDSVRDAGAEKLAEYKAELKARQTQDLRERQTLACDALREQRDVQYQELLQRQREERGALQAGMLLDGLPVIRASTPDAATDKTANQNTGAEHAADNSHQAASVWINPGPVAPETSREPDVVSPWAKPRPMATSDRDAVVDSAVAKDVASSPENSPSFPMPSAPEPTKQVADLAAGAIGSVASYLADQLGEFFAPTPPELRAAQAKETAKHEAAKPAAEEKIDPYAKIIDAAVRVIEQERAAGKDDVYWKERDRGKGWERDQ